MKIILDEVKKAALQKMQDSLELNEEISFSPEEAEVLGAFREEAISESDLNDVEEIL